MRIHNLVLAFGICALIGSSALGQLEGLLSGSAPAGGDPKYSAKLFAIEGTHEGVIEFTLEVPEGWKVYDVTETPGGVGVPAAMKLPDPAKTKTPNGFEIAGEWVPDHEPKLVEEDGDLHPVHYGVVTWKAPVKFEEGVNPKNLKTKIKFTGQICATSCRPLSEQVAVSFEGYIKKDGKKVEEAPAKKPEESKPAPKPSAPPKKSDTAATPKSEPLKAALPELLVKSDASSSDPTYSAQLHLAEGGKEGVLEFSMTVPKGWKTYDVNEDKAGVGVPSQMLFYDKSKDTKGVNKPADYDFAGPWVPTHEPKIDEVAGGKHLIHYGEVTWKARLKFVEGVDAKDLAIKVYYTGQICTISLSSCKPLKSVVEVTLGDAIAASELEKLPVFGATRVSNSGPTKDANAASAAPMLSSQSSVLDNLAVEGSHAEYPFGMIVLLALAGGFILNFMPCVLPVIGLKIASFVEQAGESRGRIIMLNIYYSLGLLSVFMVLATLAAFWSFGWGQQNQSAVFNIVMASVVFAMGLSMIGVWEIPIPGLAMSTSANKLSQKEGPQGAFFKGILTTVLAVPCSGPGLATAIAYCQNKPPYIIYAVFFFLALGMASPYLLIGAYPALIRLLPKPGEWMETFKQVMGFVLLGTVVFLLTYIPLEYVVPTIALLFGIWMGCWWFGRVPMWESRGKRMKAALFAFGLVGAVAALSFLWLDDVMKERVEKNALALADRVKERLANGEDLNPNKLAWKPYSVNALGQLTGQKRTVMVDFTADWCLTCKWLESNVLNTKEVKELVDSKKIDTLMADWTIQDNPEIEETLERLGSNKQIPVLAIFPADNPKKPIVLMGLYSQKTLLETLKQATGESAPSAIATKPSRDAKEDLSLAAKSAQAGSKKD
jgi:suppressor for copper-sensitivity B